MQDAGDLAVHAALRLGAKAIAGTAIAADIDWPELCAHAALGNHMACQVGGLLQVARDTCCRLQPDHIKSTSGLRGQTDNASAHGIGLCVHEMVMLEYERCQHAPFKDLRCSNRPSSHVIHESPQTAHSCRGVFLLSYPNGLYFIDMILSSSWILSGKPVASWQTWTPILGRVPSKLCSCIIFTSTKRNNSSMRERASQASCHPAAAFLSLLQHKPLASSYETCHRDCMTTELASPAWLQALQLEGSHCPGQDTPPAGVHVDQVLEICMADRLSSPHVPYEQRLGQGEGSHCPRQR